MFALSALDNSALPTLYMYIAIVNSLHIKSSILHMLRRISLLKAHLFKYRQLRNKFRYSKNIINIPIKIMSACGGRELMADSMIANPSPPAVFTRPKLLRVAIDKQQ